MTRADALGEWYGLVVASLQREASEAFHERGIECEAASPEREARCAANRRRQLGEARRAGLLKENRDADS